MLAQQPDRLDGFMKSMAAGEAAFPITGVYDFSWLVDQLKMDPSSKRPVFVDVGGGMGHAIKAIHREYPQLPISRFVLQDTPETLEAGKALHEAALAEIQRIPVNFHEEPPIKGMTEISYEAWWVGAC